MYKDVQLPRGVGLPGRFEESESDWANHLGSHLAQLGTVGCEPKGATSRRWLVRFTQQRKPGGSWGGQAGGDLPLSWKHSSGAGIPVGLAFHSGGDLQSREDKERHCSVSSASSPSQTAARLWVGAHPPSRATKTSKCTAGPCVGTSWQSHHREPKCREILGKCCSRRPDEGHDSRSRHPQCLQPMWKAKSQEGCRWTRPALAFPEPRTRIAIKLQHCLLLRSVFAADGHVKCWCRFPHTSSEPHAGSCADLSLAKNTTPPSWQTLLHSFRCSCRQCSRS